VCFAGISSRAEDGLTLAVAADGRFHSPGLGPRVRTDEKRRSALGQRGFSGILAEQGKRQSWCCGATVTTAIRSEVFIPGSTGSHLQLSSQEP
jgi:hypothetical protein